MHPMSMAAAAAAAVGGRAAAHGATEQDAAFLRLFARGRGPPSHDMHAPKRA